MKGKLFAVVVSAFTLTFASCLHTDFGYENSGRAWVRVTEGNAVLNISARVARNVYWGPDQSRIPEPGEERRPVIPAGSVTRNETVHLSAGEEHTLRVIPSETVMIHIVSVDGGDVELTSRDTRGRERTHSVSGKNRLGITIAF